MLFEVFAFFVHGPEVHGAVAIAYEVDPVIVVHGAGTGSGEVGCEVYGFLFPIEAPDLFYETSFITFGL